jgi:hypothetical protein
MVNDYPVFLFWYFDKNKVYVTLYKNKTSLEISWLDVLFP